MTVAETAVGIVAVADAGAAVADAIAVDALKVVRVADAICLLQSTRRLKAANREATIIAALSRAGTRTGARKLHGP